MTLLSDPMAHVARGENWSLMFFLLRRVPPVWRYGISKNMIPRFPYEKVHAKVFAEQGPAVWCLQRGCVSQCLAALARHDGIGGCWAGSGCNGWRYYCHFLDLLLVDERFHVLASDWDEGCFRGVPVDSTSSI
jgi:hypothetical protein